jgi:hypothetical protein
VISRPARLCRRTTSGAEPGISEEDGPWQLLRSRGCRRVGGNVKGCRVWLSLRPQGHARPLWRLRWTRAVTRRRNARAAHAGAMDDEARPAPSRPRRDQHTDPEPVSQSDPNDGSALRPHGPLRRPSPLEPSVEEAVCRGRVAATGRCRLGWPAVNLRQQQQQQQQHHAVGALARSPRRAARRPHHHGGGGCRQGSDGR